MEFISIGIVEKGNTISHYTLSKFIRDIGEFEFPNKYKLIDFLNDVPIPLSDANRYSEGKFKSLTLELTIKETIVLQSLLDNVLRKSYIYPSLFLYNSYYGFDCATPPSPGVRLYTPENRLQSIEGTMSYHFGVILRSICSQLIERLRIEILKHAP